MRQQRCAARNASRTKRRRGGSHMAFDRPWRRVGVLVAAFVGALALAACGGLGESKDDGGGAGGKVTLSFLVDNSDQTLKPAQALASAFHAKNPDITVKVETRPQGADGDNVVKTRLATREMTDVFQYNSGSLFQALSPEKNLAPVTNETFVKDLEK